MNPKSVQRVVILGGGTAGWMAAAMMARRYENSPLDIEVIESPDIPTVGVGEATVPGIQRMHRALGISEADFIRATGATFKLGIEFCDWREPGHRFFHPFADFGSDIAGRPFYDCWLKLQLEGHRSDLGAYSLPAQMAAQGRFAQPDPQASSPLVYYDYAYHFDAARYAGFLSGYAQERGVRYRRAKVIQVETDTVDGSIRSLVLADQTRVPGDLFVDCSGFRSMMLGQALEVPFEPWSDLLPCDRAVVVQTENTAGFAPCTRSTACEAGWQWRIPLKHRCGNGYVYCSRYVDDEQAQADFMSRLCETPIGNPRLLSFEAGMRRVFWHKNVVALGLASGFVEPLESTSISLIQTGVEKLLQFMPDLCLEQPRIDEANRLNCLEYERIRDFIFLHYYLSRRTDTAFWRSFQERPVPGVLQEKLDRFDRYAEVILHPQESFRAPSWMAMYNGFGRLPSRSPETGLDAEPLTRAMDRMASLVREAASRAPGHSSFLGQVHQV